MYNGMVNNNTIFHSFLIKTTVRKRFLPCCIIFFYFLNPLEKSESNL